MLRIVVCLVACVIISTSIVMAQPEGGERPEGGRPPGGPGGRGGFAPPPVFSALDPNGDGEISAEELNSVVDALKKLDKNGDGKLTREEYMGDRFGRGPGGPGGGAPGGPPAAGGPTGRPGGDMVNDRLKQMDKDGDGKISKDEAPDRMKENFDKMDKNGDGFIDKEEISAMFQGFIGRRPGGDNGGKRPDGEGDKKPEGDKPARPISENDI